MSSRAKCGGTRPPAPRRWPYLKLLGAIELAATTQCGNRACNCDWVALDLSIDGRAFGKATVVSSIIGPDHFRVETPEGAFVMFQPRGPRLSEGGELRFGIGPRYVDYVVNGVQAQDLFDMVLPFIPDHVFADARLD
jgi:hypothetical protein